MQVKALFANNSLRNYIYLLEDTASKQAICIDPFDAQMVFDYLSLKEYQLVEIWNTHFHHDHIRGNEDLAKMTQAKIRKFEGGEKEEVFGYQMEVLFSPGHTLDHVTFLLEGEKKFFFSGDTIFQSSIGNCKNGGDVVTLYNTLQELKQRIPDDATLYIGHDYFLSNLKFCESIGFELELVKQYMDRIRKRKFGEFFFLTMGEEKKINPYLNADEKTFIKLREKRDNW